MYVANLQPCRNRVESDNHGQTVRRELHPPGRGA